MADAKIAPPNHSSSAVLVQGLTVSLENLWTSLNWLSFFQTCNFQFILHHAHQWFSSNPVWVAIWVPVPNSKVWKGRSFPHATNQLNSSQFWHKLPLITPLRLPLCPPLQMPITSLGCHLCSYLTSYRLEVPTILPTQGANCLGCYL